MKARIQSYPADYCSEMVKLIVKVNSGRCCMCLKGLRRS